MKMDRNTNPDGAGKYALINLRKVPNDAPEEVKAALRTLEAAGVLDWGAKGSPGEFFVMRLRDINSRAALLAYAMFAQRTDKEWANEVLGLYERSGTRHPNCKLPD